MKVLSLSLILSLFMLVGFQSYAQQGNKKAEKQVVKKDKSKLDKQTLTGLSKADSGQDKMQKKEAKLHKKSSDASKGSERANIQSNKQNNKSDRTNSQLDANEQTEGEGHAYGKKKDVSGKEFSKVSTKEAKMVNQKKIVETNASIDKAEESIQKAYEKLKLKQEGFRKDLLSGDLTQEDYDHKTVQVKKALDHIEELKQKINAGREQIK